MMRVRSVACSLAACVLLGLVGCAQPVYPVRGQVTFDGKPLTGGGAIAFIRSDGRKGKDGGGDIAEDGTYQLTEGVSAGEFRVVIAQTTDREPKNTGDDEKTPAPAIVAVPLADRIPALFADHQNSPLKATVEAKAINEIDFHLKRN